MQSPDGQAALRVIGSGIGFGFGICPVCIMSFQCKFVLCGRNRNWNWNRMLTVVFVVCTTVEMARAGLGPGNSPSKTGKSQVAHLAELIIQAKRYPFQRKPFRNRTCGNRGCRFIVRWVSFSLLSKFCQRPRPKTAIVAYLGTFNQ